MQQHFSTTTSRDPVRFTARKAECRALAEEVTVTMVDAFRTLHCIKWIRLLKLDAGGTSSMSCAACGELWRKDSGLVQFEFGGTHLDSRTYRRDLYDVLGDPLETHRVVRDGLRPLGSRNERVEVFRLGNHVALHESRRLHGGG